MREDRIKYVHHILIQEEEGLETDSLGNYLDYKGLDDNIITKEDDIMVMQTKIFTQEEWLVQNGYTGMDMLDYMDEYNKFELPGMDH